MNRTQRKYVPKFRRHEIEKERKYEFEELLPPKIKRRDFPFKPDKPMTNRCCYITPLCKDAELSTEESAFFVDDHFNTLVKQNYDVDPALTASVKRIKELKKPSGTTEETSVQYDISPYIQTADGSQWRAIDNTHDVEKFVTPVKERSESPERIENIRISEKPHIKVISEKFSKFKRNDVEIRKLVEKIVCLEYDVYESNEEICTRKPIQKMRAFFSLKPTKDNENTIKTLPSTIKSKFKISQEDLTKLNDTEIEIIDSKIAENKPYLDDLKRILNRQQSIKRQKSTLDLMALYKMAKYQNAILDESFCDLKLLSHKDLEEIKELITKKSVTSVHGLSRRTVKQMAEVRNDKTNAISQSLFENLLKYDNFDFNQVLEL